MANTTPNPDYKSELQKRLNDLREEQEMSEWETSFIRSVASHAHREGILSLSPKQISKVEELWDRYFS